MEIDQERMHQFVMKVVGNMGVSAHGPNLLIDEQLGFYKAITVNGPVTPKQLADKTGTNERYMTEWLACEAASGYKGDIPKEIDTDT